MPDSSGPSHGIEASPASVRPAARGRLRVGLIGRGIQASGSPAMHMAEARELGLDLHYELLDLDQRTGGEAALSRVLDEVQSQGFAGVNITHPCKRLALQQVDEVSTDARALGAINTVVFRDGRRFGHNTDWHGFSSSFQQGLPGAQTRRILQLGAGGAGSAVAYALLTLGASQLLVHDTDHARAAQLCAQLGAVFGNDRLSVAQSVEAEIAGCDGLVNCTPVGMAKYPGTPLPVRLLRPELWVAEIVYFPLETELLRAARALGCRTLDGGGMAVHQAADAFLLFTGHQPDVQRMLRAFRARLEQRASSALAELQSVGQSAD